MIQLVMLKEGGKPFQPVVQSGVELEWERAGTPGKLTFTVLKDAALNFHEGDAVKLFVDQKPVFFGFVFTKKRSNDGSIQVTAYDQLRYLKNKFTYCYSMTATTFLRRIAEDFQLETGELEDTGWVIPPRTEENKTLIDMLQTALDLTMQNTGKLYVLYDDCRKLTLRAAGSMKLDLVVNPATAQNFDYSSGIDGETYNQVLLAPKGQNVSPGSSYVASDKTNIGRWGLLQYFESLDSEKENQLEKANNLLRLYNRKTRSLTVSGVLGDIRVRGGSSVPVGLDLGDLELNHYLLVDKVKHKFQPEGHTMDLTLRGGPLDA